jgi:hypothetical protein
MADGQAGQKRQPDTKTNPDSKTADAQPNDSQKNDKALSPKELGQISGGRRSNDPCEGGQVE